MCKTRATSKSGANTVRRGLRMRLSLEPDLEVVSLSSRWMAAFHSNLASTGRGAVGRLLPAHQLTRHQIGDYKS